MPYDVVVCGAGIIGLWTACHLAEQNKSVLLLEQIGHKYGSSQGYSRIFRSAYTTKQHGDLMPESTLKWNQLEKESCQQLLVPCQYIDTAKNNQRKINVLENIGVEYKELTFHEIRRQFPGFSPNGFNGILDLSGGVLKANACLIALEKSLLHLGGKIQDNEEVLGVEPVSKKLVKIHTNKGMYESVSVVLTCGSWINKIVSKHGVTLPVKPLEVDVVFWKARHPEIYSIDNFPSTYIVFSDTMKVYSTPIMEYPGLMKVCLHQGVEVENKHRQNLSKNIQLEKTKNMKTLTEIVKNCYPGLIPVPAFVETCIYSMTPDRDFIIDNLPGHENIVIGTGFSGHGFKLSPVVGKILGELSMFKQPSYDVKHFALSRFSSKSNL